MFTALCETQTFRLRLNKEKDMEAQVILKWIELHLAADTRGFLTGLRRVRAIELRRALLLGGLPRELAVQLFLKII